MYLPPPPKKKEYFQLKIILRFNILKICVGQEKKEGEKKNSWCVDLKKE